MAYCRWSHMQGKCDVYAYEDCYGGYTIHLAKSKRKNTDKAPPYPDIYLIIDEPEKYQELRKAYNEWSESEEGNQFEELTLKHAGESFHEDDLEDFRDRMTYLREIGYTFPDEVFSWIDEEITERDNDLLQKDSLP